MKRLAYMIPILLGFVCLDAWLTDGRTAGRSRNSVIGSMTRWARADHTPIIVLGSSTTGDIMPPKVVAAALGVSKSDVIIGRINGCHQGCTWAQVRALAQRADTFNRGRLKSMHRVPRFDHVLMGLNLFQQCEDGHSKRVLQQIMLTPPRDLPALFALYRHAEHPLRRVGRALGMLASGVYGEPSAVKHRMRAESAFSLSGAWWSSRELPKKTAFCDYADGPIQLKTAFMQSLVDDLADMSGRVTLVLLPDRALAARDPAQIAQLPAFRAWVQAIAARHPKIDVLDLIAGNPATSKDFRDSIHFRNRPQRHQRAFFIDAYRAQLGAAPP